MEALLSCRMGIFPNRNNRKQRFIKNEWERGPEGRLFIHESSGECKKGKCAEGGELSKAVSSDTGMGSYCQSISD